MASDLRVLLVSAPWHALERPSLGLGLLQAGLGRDGVACDVRYLGFELADAIGLADYLWVQSRLPHTAFAGEWLFTECLYGERRDTDAAYVDAVLRHIWGLSEQGIDRLVRLRESCRRFMEHCLRSIPWGDYDVVGFTSTFEQNLASLALARRVKQLYPETVIVFGGANWESTMGQELHSRFPFVDAVFSGEADVSFPSFVQALGKGTDLSTVPGLILRRDGAVVRTAPAPPIMDLDRLPPPDYDAYFAALSASESARPITPILLLETSRGCWWGARHHCTFCGLNGETMAFRSKSPERVLDEIHELRRRHGVGSASVVDNILDMRYFATVLPALASAGAPMNLFYEVKANLTAEQVKLLADAGVRRIQPGLESLSDHVLSLMRKGTTALQNVQLLKWCREFGVKPEWNLLYGFPGETPEDYAQLGSLIDSIDFLTPPVCVEPIRLDRFSPYHADPARFGLTNVRPMAAYRYLYPFPEEALHRIAYYFDFDYADHRDPLHYAGPALDRAKRWMERGPGGTLTLLADAGMGLVLIDTRHEGTASYTLTGWRAALYARCDKVTSERAAIEAGVGEGATEEEVRAFLDDCLRRGLMARVSDRWLALAVNVPHR